MSKSIGSMIAKNGFKEEEFIVNLLNSNTELLNGLSKFIGKKLEPNARLIKGNHKSDLVISGLTIQHKKTKPKQFGQVDRHYVDDLIECIPKIASCSKILKNLCEKPIDPETNLCKKNSKIKKIDSTNYSKKELQQFVEILENNKKKLLNYAFRGKEKEYRPKLFSITLFDKNNKREKLIVWKMKDIINHLMKYDVKIKDSKTTIEISNGLTFQRKGGDGGKKQANNFQFKFIPTTLPTDSAFVYTF
jgi:hypothetical protein